MTLPPAPLTSNHHHFAPPILQGHHPSFIYKTIYQTILLVITVALTVILLLMAVGDFRLIVPTTIILSIQLVGLFLVLRGKIYGAALLIPTGIFAGIFVSSFYIPDYYALGGGFYGLTILMAGTLLGKREVWLTAVVALIVQLISYTYQLTSPNNLHFFLSAIQITLFALTTNLIVFYVNQNYARFTQSYQQLKQAQTKLQQFANELQESNHALRHSQQTKQAILDSIPDMMAIITREGLYLDYKALSYFREEDPPEVAIGKTVHELLSPEMAAQRLANIATVLDTGEVLAYEESQSARGELHHFAVRIMTLNKEEETVLVMMRDITREKERERIELAKQKLESVGLLAGGIAHDFNNLLTGMMAQTSLAIRKLEGEHTAVRHIEKANKAMQRAAHLTQQLLAYTGQGHFQLTQVNLNELLRENVEFLQAGLLQPVVIQLQLAPDLPPLIADAGQIQQVVMNLIINAAEASPKPDAHIEVSTQQYTQAQLQARLQQANQPHTQLKDEAYLCLTIRDEGIGMPPETVQRIFDPFFTTKEHGRGLGLSAIWGIIHSYNGSIHVDSTPGQGTTFTIYLPLNKTPASINLNHTLPTPQKKS